MMQEKNIQALAEKIFTRKVDTKGSSSSIITAAENSYKAAYLFYVVTEKQNDELWQASKDGDIDKVKEKIQQGATYLNLDGAMFDAAEYGHTSIFNRLMNERITV